jgi:hypothetical protein
MFQICRRPPCSIIEAFREDLRGMQDYLGTDWCMGTGRARGARRTM